MAETESPTIEQCFAEIRKLTRHVNLLEQEVSGLRDIIEEQQSEIRELKANQITSTPPFDANASFLQDSKLTTESFKEFLRCDEKAQLRNQKAKQVEKLKALREIYSTMKELNQIGEKNEIIFDSINLYISLLQELQPSQDSWTWTQWWSSTNTITLPTVKEALKNLQEDKNNSKRRKSIEIVENVVDEILEEQNKHAATALSWQLYLSSAKSDVEQVKEKLVAKLDNSGFELCKKLENLIRQLGDEPSKFIEDHCSPLLENSGISEAEHERVKEFVDSFALTDDWVLVDDSTDTEDIDVNNLTKIFRLVRNTCSVYGYHTSVDQALDTAYEYKSTCSRLKTTIEWVYFGGRLAVDPTGAVLSLLW